MNILRNSLGKNSDLKNRLISARFRAELQTNKNDAKKMVLIENKSFNRSNLNNVTPDILTEYLDIEVSQVWSWLYRKKNYLLAKLKNFDDIEILKLSGRLDPHSFPVRSRMIECSLDFSSFKETQFSKKCEVYDFTRLENSKVLHLEKLRKFETDDDLIEYLTEKHSMSEFDLHIRYFMLTQLEELLCQGVFNGFHIDPFGSSLTGLGNALSDLDLVFVRKDVSRNIPVRSFRYCSLDVKSERDQAQESLSLLAETTRHYLPNFHQVNRILRARVPIVKMSFKPLPLQLDLSMCLSKDNGHDGVKMAAYISYCCQRHIIIKQFFLFLKIWARQHELVKTYPGPWFSNFQIITLAICYLQVRNFIAPIDGYIASTSDKDMGIQPVKDLLTDFFYFIISFDFEKNAFSMLESRIFTKPDYAPIYVENPMETTLNIFKNVSGAEFKRLILTAYNSLEEVDKPEFRLVNLFDPELLKTSKSSK